MPLYKVFQIGQRWFLEVGLFWKFWAQPEERQKVKILPVDWPFLGLFRFFQNFYVLKTLIHPLAPQARIDPEMQFRQKSIFHHEESILSNNPKHVRSQLSMPFLWYITPYNILTRKKIRAKKLKKKS